MGYKEAIEDNVKTLKKGRQTIYFLKCANCGREIERISYIRGRKNICDCCKSIEKGKADEEQVIKKEIRFIKAIERIEFMVKDFSEYDTAIKKVKQVLHRQGYFQSTEEIMVAIELLKNNVKTIHQQKIGKYKVDFLLPDEKVILEVDGSAFHNDLAKEGERDGYIKLVMGRDWNIVRVKDYMINQNITKLMKAIKASCELQQK